MGYSNWTDDAYEELSKSRASAPVNKIFLNNDKGAMDPLMNPFELQTRESRDSDEHPDSLAIMVALDVTGSMGSIPLHLVKYKLGALMNTLIANGIKHPQIMFLAVGDQYSDRAPLQVGQFESGNKELDKWLTSIWIEENGGGGCFESYSLPWLVAARHTEIDCFLKRQQKGFLFTIGDERVHPVLDSSVLAKIMGYKEPGDIAARDILEEAQRTFHVYHIHANQGSYPNEPKVFDQWKSLIGENFLVMDDKDSIAELIATTVAVINGSDAKAILGTFNSKTSKAVGDAIKGLVKVETAVGKNGVVNL